MRRLKRRISWRQFSAWSTFHRLYPVDGNGQRDRLLAQVVVLLSRQAGNNELEVDDLLPNPFGERPEDDLQTIVQAFNDGG